METGLRNKAVLITGASKGIGKAIAASFVEEGSRVMITARGEQELKQAVLELQQLNKDANIEIFAGDLTQKDIIQQLVEATIQRFGTIDVLVNNAGSIGSGGSFDAISDEEWLQVFDLNLFSLVKLTRAVLPHMQKQHSGRIINISSESGIQPDPEMAPYNATKAAIINLSKTLSKAYGKDGILVNTVSPAFVSTPLVEDMIAQQAKAQNISPEEAQQRFLSQKRPHIELRRPGRPEEVGPAVVFLASDKASFITGTNLRVDGGSVASI